MRCPFLPRSLPPMAEGYTEVWVWITVTTITMRAKDSPGLPQEPSQTSQLFLLPLLYLRPSSSPFKAKTSQGMCELGDKCTEILSTSASRWGTSGHKLRHLACHTNHDIFLWHGKVGDTLTSRPPTATWLSSLPPVSTHFFPLRFLLPESCSKLRLSLSLKILNSSSPKNHCLPMSHKALHDPDSIYNSKHISH